MFSSQIEPGDNSIQPSLYQNQRLTASIESVSPCFVRIPTACLTEFNLIERNSTNTGAKDILFGESIPFNPYSASQIELRLGDCLSLATVATSQQYKML
jgi:hypothetical protein